MFDFSNPTIFLSWLVFLPAIAALVIAFIPARGETIKQISLATTIAVFLMTAYMVFGSGKMRFAPDTQEMQHLFAVSWIPSFNIQYLLGMDGISFPLVLLTSFLSVLCMGASWPIQKHIKAYCILFLLLETGMLGVFCALDFFLFYVFWEVMLLPMYFLIGIWGGPRKEYAAIKFFLYTLVGSVLMLIAILMLYFNSDLTKLDTTQLAAARITADSPIGEQIAEYKTKNLPLHTFNILALQQIGQHTNLFDGFGVDETGTPITFWGAMG